MFKSLRTPFAAPGARSSLQKGFSLVELMIVIGIIGVLATLAMPKFKQFQARAKMSEAKTMLRTVVQLEQVYAQDNNTFVQLDRIGRGSDGAIVCTVTNNAIGFTPEPCTAAAAAAAGPVPRYGYQVLAANVSTNVSFQADAISGGNGTANPVCPGNNAHTISMRQDSTFSADPAVGTACPN